MWYPNRLAVIRILTAVSLWAASWSDHLTRGNLRFDQGQYREAIGEYEGALPLAPTPRDRAVALFRVAVSHGRLSEFAAAERCYREALAIFRAEGDYQRSALSLSGLGEIYRAENRLDEALATERRALMDLKPAGTQQTRGAADILGITGAILADKHSFRAAERLIRQAAAILETIGGPKDLDLAMTLNNLGVIALARKHPAESEALLTRALGIREAHFGPEHPLIASTLLSLSSVYLAQKCYADADSACRHAVEMMRRFLPANHPDVIRGNIELALIAHGSGNPAAAAGILEDAMGSSHGDPANITREYIQLVSLYSKYLGDAGEAERSRQFHLEAQQLLQQFRRTSVAGSTVSLSELEAGGFQ